MTDYEQKQVFAKNLNKYISLNQKQQIDVANDLGINPTTLNMWCNAKSMPSTCKIRKLANYFRIVMTDLTDEKESVDIDTDDFSKTVTLMNRVSIADRLKQIMQERNLKQVDIVNLSLPICAQYNIKMSKSNISQYVSGKIEPSPEKLLVLGMALNVTESWLMGFDTSPERKHLQAEKDFDIFYKYSLLSERDKKIVYDMIDSMLSGSGA